MFLFLFSVDQGRAETSGGAGAQSIKWGTWKQDFIGLCSKYQYSNIYTALIQQQIN